MRRLIFGGCLITSIICTVLLFCNRSIDLLSYKNNYRISKIESIPVNGTIIYYAIYKDMEDNIQSKVVYDEELKDIADSGTILIYSHTNLYYLTVFLLILTIVIMAMLINNLAEALSSVDLDEVFTVID